MSTNAVEAPIAAPGMILETSTRCICTNANCDNREIPRHCVQANIKRDTGVQDVLAWCESCDTLYRVRRRSYAGEWVPVGQIEIVTDQRTRKGFMHRMAHLRGEMQRTSA